MGPNQRYNRAQGISPGLDEEGKFSRRQPSRGDQYKAWGNALRPLVAHGVLTIFITAFVAAGYLKDGHFNVNDRRPLVPLADGTKVPWVRFAPLQSDITTILSFSLAIHRLATAWWLGPLSWRFAFILLETTGLRTTQMHAMISYGTPGFTTGGGLASGIIAAVLVAVMPVHIAAPIVTGSITWVPSHDHPAQLSDSLVPIPSCTGHFSQDIWFSLANPQLLSVWQATAAALIGFTWGNDKMLDVTRRIVPSVGQLAANSTLTNITLPYFSVATLEWIKDPKHNLTSGQLDLINPDDPISCDAEALLSQICVPRVKNVPFIIPEKPFLNTSVSPSVVSGRQLMALLFPSGASGSESCDFSVLSSSTTFPAHIGLYKSIEGCWAFAWINFTAGAAECRQCQVVSNGVVQNNTELTLHEDRLVNPALLYLSNVSSISIDKAFFNYISNWENIDEYVIGQLTRSYSASWSILTNDVCKDGTGVDPSLYTTYSVAPSSLQASVDTRRLYIWLGLQSLVTLSGIAFLYVQRRHNSPIIGDTTLAAFFLIIREGSDQYDSVKGGAARELEYEGDSMKVKLL